MSGNLRDRWSWDLRELIQEPISSDENGSDIALGQGLDGQ